MKGLIVGQYQGSLPENQVDSWFPCTEMHLQWGRGGGLWKVWRKVWNCLWDVLKRCSLVPPFDFSLNQNNTLNIRSRHRAAAFLYIIDCLGKSQRIHQLENGPNPDCATNYTAAKNKLWWNKLSSKQKESNLSLLQTNWCVVLFHIYPIIRKSLGFPVQSQQSFNWRSRVC